MACPQGTLLLCLNVKPKCLCLWKHPEAVHLRMAAKKEEIYTSPTRGWPFQEIFARLMTFLLYFLTFSRCVFYKRNWHSGPNKMAILRH